MSSLDAIGDYETHDDAYEYDGCCALEDGHDGPCARICSECHGSLKCRECDDLSVDDFSGCGECGGAGGCSYCEGGMVSDVD